MKNSIKEKIIQFYDSFAPLAASFILVGILVRVYEYVVVSGAFVLPDHAVALYFSGLFFDLLYMSFLLLVFGLFSLAVFFIHEKTALWITGIIMGLFLAVYVALVQYFGEVLSPLGADFFAYSFIEVSDTVNTSVDITAGRVLPLLIFPALFAAGWYLFSRLEWQAIPKVLSILYGAVAVMGLLYLIFYPAQENYEREIEYQLLSNKASIFFGYAVAEILPGTGITEFSGDEYPLLRKAADDDPLGEFLNQSSQTPNLVFIIVESLGAAVMEPHGRYKGFAPYLDSLASESLYWPNFLATSGRSFNIQPSILGSLPYGNRGFMDMGAAAPDHHSLISILNDNHYHTAYYCGYNSRFDKLDQFLERQNIDLLMDQSHFGDEYQKMDEIEGGFTWGYSDKDTYQRAFDYIDEMPTDTPRLDFFLSVNFHEPFIIPETEEYEARFYERLEQLQPDDRLREELVQYREIFSALLYTDEAIKELMDRYKQRDDYENTIFVITGDHRMIPVPHASRIDRYHVPFMIYSPLIKEPQNFKGVSSHLDVTPTLIKHLKSTYNISTPDSVAWLGDNLNTSHDFSADREIPLMRNKNQMDDFVDGKYFKSGNQLFEILDGLRLRSVQNSAQKNETEEKYEQFLRLNRYVVQENKLVRVTDEMEQSRELLAEDESYFREKGLNELSNEELFFRARELAFTSQYEDARRILRKVIRESPNNYDARLLFGRTFGWDGDYEKAEEEFREVLRRNEQIAGAYSAIADLYFWQGMPDETIEIVNRGLSFEPENAQLLFRKARAYRQAGNNSRALEIVEEGLEHHPGQEDLLGLQTQLQ